MLAELSWPIIERIHIAGDFAVSPHGILVAIGFLAGAQLMLKRAEWRGVARRPIPNIPDVISAIVTRAAIGGIIGARLGFVLTRPSDFDIAEVFRVWEGGLSLLGGIAGGLILGLPYIWRRKLSLPLLLDSMAPGLALGIVIGRIGDLIIGEHLGGRTDFLLGWRCSGQYGRDVVSNTPEMFTEAQVQGCFDAVVHQTALYDMLSALAVFILLVVLERQTRFDGFFGMTFGLAYGSARLLTDFARAADKDLIGPFTGTQLTGMGLVAMGVIWLFAARHWRVTPWAWIPGLRPVWTLPEVVAEEALRMKDPAAPDGAEDAEDLEGLDADGTDTADGIVPDSASASSEAEDDAEALLGADDDPESMAAEDGAIDAEPADSERP